VKTKDLVKALQELDPSGETECFVENQDIYFAELLPAYYDGSPYVFVRDKAKEPYYDVVAAKYLGNGTKILLHTLSSYSLIVNNEEFEFDYSELTELRQQYYKDLIEQIRCEVKNDNTNR
jgi:hypothetical protein